MNTVKFSGTFTFKNLDHYEKEDADTVINTERENKLNDCYRMTSLHWEKDEDTYEVEVYNKAKTQGRLSIETIPQADKRIQTELNALDIPFEYTPKLGTSAEKKPNWLQRLVGAKKKQST